MKRKRNEMWVSNNRVLNGGKKITGRNPNFDAEETKVLISIWGDPKVQKTLITTHKKHTVIVKLAERLKEYGYNRSPEEINTRIKNLKCFYNRLKKDLEMGLAPEPTWKHYAAMDEIMKQPIFSVRPNEIPKPSLRYRLEEEMREREERIKNGDVEERIVSEHSGNDEENDAGQSEVDFDDDDERPLKIKEENVDTFEEIPLIIPKEEPIDIEESEFKNVVTHAENSEEINLSEFISRQSSSGSISSTAPACVNQIITTIATSLAKPTTMTSPGSLTINSCPKKQLLLSSSQKSNLSPGKISLVPTNLLLQPQKSQHEIQIRPQQQHRILYTQQTSKSNPGIVTGPGGMKVLFVNAMQQGTTAGTGPTTEVTQSRTTIPAPKLINTPLQAHTLNNTPDTVNVSSEQHTTVQDKSNSDKKEVIGFRALLSSLIKSTNENNALQRMRLEVERERLEFEKSVAQKLIDALPRLLGSQTFPLEQTSVEQSTIPRSTSETIEIESMRLPDSNSSSIEAISNEYPLLSPKIEKENE